MVAYEIELRMELLKQAQRKLSAMNEICRLTVELGTELSRDDRVSQQMVLDMRKEEMDKVDECDKHIHLLIESTEKSMREKLWELFLAKEEIQTETVEEEMIVEIVKNTQSVLERTVEMDQRLSSRLAGEDSFYKK